jgi:hypothetical protein
MVIISLVLMLSLLGLFFYTAHVVRDRAELRIQLQEASANLEVTAEMLKDSRIEMQKLGMRAHQTPGEVESEPPTLWDRLNEE